MLLPSQTARAYGLDKCAALLLGCDCDEGSKGCILRVYDRVKGRGSGLPFLRSGNDHCTSGWRRVGSSYRSEIGGYGVGV